jgi:hypothetical protein
MPSLINRLDHVSVFWCRYLLIGLALQLIIRGVVSAFSAWYLKVTPNDEHPTLIDENFGRLLWWCARGWFPRATLQLPPGGGPPRHPVSDICLPFVIGLIELYSYPVLMKLDQLTIIAAWIGLKTVAQWTRWTGDRSVFNRYLLANLLVILASLYLTRFVTDSS